MTIHKLFDWGEDPNYGAVLFVYWDQANPAQGEYTWTKLDEALNKIEAQRLPNGKRKPAQVFIQFHESTDTASGIYFTDHTPQWVYANQNRPVVNGKKVGHLLSSGGKKAVLPAYEDEHWQAAYYQMVEEFIAHVAQFECVTSVIVSVGLDSETHIAKEWGGIDWNAVMQSAPGGIEYGWGGWHPPYRTGFVFEAMDVYSGEVINTSIDAYLNCAPGGNARVRIADYAVERGIGLKHSGVLPDAENHKGRWKMDGDKVLGMVGSWDMIEKHGKESLIWAESAQDMGDKNWMYWALIAALHYHPDNMSLHGGFFQKADPKWLEWADRYLGVTPEITPDVWCVLRDSEYPLQGTEANGVSGHEGNWEFYLHAEGGSRVWEKDLPKELRGHLYSRQCRWADASHLLTIAVDPDYKQRFSRFEIKTIVALKSPDDWNLAFQWEEIVQETPDPDLLSFEEGYFHKIVVKGIENVEPPPPPEPPEETLQAQVERLEAYLILLRTALDARLSVLEGRFNSLISANASLSARIEAIWPRIVAIEEDRQRYADLDLTVLAKKGDS